MLTIDQLRSALELRRLSALESLKEAKKHLENATVLAETREREFREVSEDVRRRIEALDLVASMAKELDDEIPAERRFNAAENEPVLMFADANGGIRPIEGEETSAPIRSTTPVPHGRGDERLTKRNVLLAMDWILGEFASLQDRVA